MGLALLYHSNLAIKYCEDAFLTTTYIINRLPTKILQTKTHFEMVYQKPPYYGFFYVFLVMFVGPIYVRTIITKLILYLKLVFLMAIILVIKVTNVLI